MPVSLKFTCPVCDHAWTLHGPSLKAWEAAEMRVNCPYHETLVPCLGPEVGAVPDDERSIAPPV